MKTSTFLKHVKAELDMHNRTDGLCLAIDRVTKKLGVNEWEAYELTNEISARLHPFAYAHIWLAHQMVYSSAKPRERTQEFEKRQEWIGAQSARDIQRWRKAWINELIKEYRAKGD